MNREGYKKLAVISGIYAVMALSVMFYRAGTKRIIIADAAENDYSNTDITQSYSLRARAPEGTDEEGKLIVPLPGGVHSENVRIENRYIEHRLILYVDAKDTGFYKSAILVADIDNLNSAICVPQSVEGEVALIFQLDGIYESVSELTDDSIVITFEEPGCIYDKMVVVDPLCGGEFLGSSSGNVTEKDINLSVALALKNIADADTENNFKVFFTRTSDIYRDEAVKTEFVEETGADLYIQIMTEADTIQNEGIATYYNDNYFIRNFGNVQFADTLEKNVLSSTGVNARGVLPCENESALRNIKIPSAAVSVGNISIEADADRLTDKKYINKVAQGIYDGIVDSLSELE
ncbi:MAG: N-acetylmuramoyl-L-alanine amidase [Butyrivibrio sp.]|nr:N-acetylmuramoyl-L-alanine amidase [Butyrivibrio sp.]